MLVAALAITVLSCSSEVEYLRERSAEQKKEIPVMDPVKLDILFVIDNSASMQGFQESLETNIGGFANVLNDIKDRVASIHLGVISADLGTGPYRGQGCSEKGDDGILQHGIKGNDSCSMLSDSYIIDDPTPDGSRIKNYSGSLAEAFGCIANLGHEGCEFQQPLAAMKRTLERQSAVPNSGFLRPEAYLAVYFITNQDDCSVFDTGLFDNDSSLENNDSPLGFLSTFRCFEFGVQCASDLPRIPGVHSDCEPRSDSPYMSDVQEYVSFLRDRKDDPGKIIVGVIRGQSGADMSDSQVAVALENGKPTLAASCCGDDCAAPVKQTTPAIRLDAFAAAFPQRHTLTDFCEDNLSDVLTVIATYSPVGPPNLCIDGDLTLVDGSPVCTGADIQNYNQDGHTESLLPACNESVSNLPCFRFEEELENCQYFPTHLSIIIERGSTYAPANTTSVIRCELN